MMSGVAVPPIVAEAARRSSVAWVGLDGARPKAVWYLWHDGACWLVTAGGAAAAEPAEVDRSGALDPAAAVATAGPAAAVEQQLKGAHTATTALVALRSKERQGGLIVTFLAAVSRVTPGTTEWDQVVPLLHAARLNAADGERQPARWARSATVLRLVPTGEVVEPP